MQQLVLFQQQQHCSWWFRHLECAWCSTIWPFGEEIIFQINSWTRTPKIKYWESLFKCPLKFRGVPGPKSMNLLMCRFTWTEHVEGQCWKKIITNPRCDWLWFLLYSSLCMSWRNPKLWQWHIAYFCFQPIRGRNSEKLKQEKCLKWFAFRNKYQTWFQIW